METKSTCQEKSWRMTPKSSRVTWLQKVCSSNKYGVLWHYVTIFPCRTCYIQFGFRWELHAPLLVFIASRQARLCHPEGFPSVAVWIQLESRAAQGSRCRCRCLHSSRSSPRLSVEIGLKCHEWCWYPSAVYRFKRGWHLKPKPWSSQFIKFV